MEPMEQAMGPPPCQLVRGGTPLPHRPPHLPSCLHRQLAETCSQGSYCTYAPSAGGYQPRAPSVPPPSSPRHCWSADGGVCPVADESLNLGASHGDIRPTHQTAGSGTPNAAAAGAAAVPAAATPPSWRGGAHGSIADSAAGDAPLLQVTSCSSATMSGIRTAQHPSPLPGLAPTWAWQPATPAVAASAPPSAGALDALVHVTHACYLFPPLPLRAAKFKAQLP